MINKLCYTCIKTCKQEDTSRIIKCPKFQMRPSDKKFREMVEDMNSAEREAKKIQKTIRELLLTKDVSGTADNEKEVEETG